MQVAKTVREAAVRLTGTAKPASQPELKQAVRDTPARAQPNGPRSSNLRVAKTFTQRDKDQFQIDTFEFVARFFENSLTELGARNPGVEGVFRRVDANRFFATVYRDGKDVARATIYTGGEGFGRGINYVRGETLQSNAMNETVTVHANDQTLYLNSLGTGSFGGDRDQKLTQEGAAELFWSILIDPLQHSNW